MAAQGFKCSSLTGGGAGALDSFDGSVPAPGAGPLVDGDFAIVITPAGGISMYLLDEDSGLTESSPTIIAPDTNAGDKRWIQALFGDAIGNGQTWSAPTRVGNTAYQNTTGRAIQVCMTVVCSVASGSEFATLRVGPTSTGAWTAIVNFTAGPTAGEQFLLSAIIPAGSWYMLYLTANMIKATWTELR